MIKEEFKQFLGKVDENDLSPKFRSQFEEPEKKESAAAKEIVLDSMSSIADVTFAAKYLGFELSNEDISRVYEAVMAICSKKESIGSAEFSAIISSHAKQVPETYQLLAYMASSGNKVDSVASVSLLRDGFEYNGVAGGGGPIDAAFNAINTSLGVHFVLEKFTISAITEGKESLGQTSVTLRKGDKLYTGSGISTDIVEASINAYINALNQIFYEEG